MASNYLPSIFHNRSNNKKDTSSLLSKRATVSSAKQFEELAPPLQRSNTTLSKVKKFGSLLVRNKKSENKTRADSIFPPRIDTNPSADYNLSTTSTQNASSSDDDDEDDVLTPTTTSSFPSHLLDLPAFAHQQQPAVDQQPAVNQQQDHTTDILPVTPEIETNQDLAEKDVITETRASSNLLTEEPESIVPIVVDPETLSGVSLVRYHLELAFEEAEKAIEEELDFHHHQMLQNIRATPIFLF